MVRFRGRVRGRGRGRVGVRARVRSGLGVGFVLVMHLVRGVMGGRDVPEVGLDTPGWGQG